MSMVGKSLAHYEITAEIGKGGMGEVYQAKDTKLGRDIAIKVLPEEFARDGDRIARFQREAKLLASLNHSNIAAIHGLEAADGAHFLVLELVEGQTLAERIKGGPIDIEEALKLGLQIAEALEAAHEKGVIHRDLKPANIKVTPEGKVKVLDFGLAKAYAGDPENMNLSNSPTLSDMATQQGVILGTAAYMPPEQAKGKTVDKRADIWAFGVVLFEMLTGRQLFAGETASEILAAVIKSEPEWNSLPPNLHPRIRFLLERCLEKDPRNRYSGVNDARVDIEKVLADPGGVFARPAASSGSPTLLRQILLWGAVTVILVIVAGIVAWNLKGPEPRQVVHLGYELPEDQQLMQTPWGSVSVAVSPDGSKFVYLATDGLYLRSLDQSDARRMPISDNIGGAFFSPDSKWLGYFSTADKKLKKIAISDGVPMDLCELQRDFAGAHWCQDNTIVFSEFPAGIMRIPDTGGTPEPLFNTGNAGLPLMANILPGGKNVLFTSLIDGQTKNVMIYSLESGEMKELFPGESAVYYPTGHIVYNETNSRKLCARTFDLDRLQDTGGTVLLMDGIVGSSLAQNGTFIYVKQAGDPLQPGDAGFSEVRQPGRTLWWVDRSGVGEQIDTPEYMYNYLKISPDGEKIALTADIQGNLDIYVLDLFRDNVLSQLTFNKLVDQQAVWSPDSERIAYTAMGSEVDEIGGVFGIYLKAADGTGEAEYLSTSPGKVVIPYSWSEDGETLLTGEVPGSMKNFDIGMIPLEGDHTNQLLLKEECEEKQPQLSPNGQWLAYTSDESGKTQVYVRHFPDMKGRWKLSTDAEGGNSPRWSHDGTELFYIVGDNVAEKVMRVKVETETSFSHGNPEVLFEGDYLGMIATNCFPYDVHPDGKRFLMMKDASPAAESAEEPKAVPSPHKINIVLNWDLELMQRVPVN